MKVAKVAMMVMAEGEAAAKLYAKERRLSALAPWQPTEVINILSVQSQAAPFYQSRLILSALTMVLRNARLTQSDEGGYNVHKRSSINYQTFHWLLFNFET